MPSNFSQRLCHLFRVVPITLLLCAGLGAANAQIKPSTERNTLYLIAGGNEEPGTSDGVGPAAQFNEPRGLVKYGENLFVVDSKNHAVRQISPDGMVTTIVGTGKCGSSDRLLINLFNIDSNGTGFGRTTFRLPASLAKTSRFCVPMGIALDDNKLFVTDSYFAYIRRIQIGPVWMGANRILLDDFSSDLGTSGDAVGIAAISGSMLFISSTKKNIIRRQDFFDQVSFRLTTIAGAEGPCGSTDGAGSDARFCHPEALALNRRTQNLYVADTRNHTIRQITLAGEVVSTFAGTPGKCGKTDGVGAAALFCNPVSIAVDEATGDLYVADTGFSLIRKITPDKTVTTVVGTPGFRAEFGPLPGAIAPPVGVAVIGPGQLAITTRANQVLGVNF